MKKYIGILRRQLQMVVPLRSMIKPSTMLLILSISTLIIITPMIFHAPLDVHILEVILANDFYMKDPLYLDFSSLRHARYHPLHYFIIFINSNLFNISAKLSDFLFFCFNCIALISTFFVIVKRDVNSYFPFFIIILFFIFNPLVVQNIISHEDNISFYWPILLGIHLLITKKELKYSIIAGVLFGYASSVYNGCLIFLLHFISIIFFIFTKNFHEVKKTTVFATVQIGTYAMICIVFLKVSSVYTQVTMSDYPYIQLTNSINESLLDLVQRGMNYTEDLFFPQYAHSYMFLIWIFFSYIFLSIFWLVFRHRDKYIKFVSLIFIAFLFTIIRGHPNKVDFILLPLVVFFSQIFHEKYYSLKVGTAVLVLLIAFVGIPQVIPFRKNHIFRRILKQECRENIYYKYLELDYSILTNNYDQYFFPIDYLSVANLIILDNPNLINKVYFVHENRFYIPYISVGVQFPFLRSDTISATLSRNQLPSLNNNDFGVNKDLHENLDKIHLRYISSTDFRHQKRQYFSSANDDQRDKSCSTVLDTLLFHARPYATSEAF